MVTRAESRNDTAFSDQHAQQSERRVTRERGRGEDVARGSCRFPEEVSAHSTRESRRGVTMRSIQKWY